MHAINNLCEYFLCNSVPFILMAGRQHENARVHGSNIHKTLWNITYPYVFVWVTFGSLGNSMYEECQSLNVISIAILLPSHTLLLFTKCLNVSMIVCHNTKTVTLGDSNLIYKTLTHQSRVYSRWYWLSMGWTQVHGPSPIVILNALSLHFLSAWSRY